MTTDTDVGEMIAVILLFVVAVVFYFLPGLIGSQKRAAVAIFFFNLIFGITGIGWIVALVWSLTPEASELDRRREFIPFDSEWPLAAPQPIGKARMMWPAVAVGVISWTVLITAGWWAWNTGLLFSAVSSAVPNTATAPPKNKFEGTGGSPIQSPGVRPGVASRPESAEIVAEEPPSASASPASDQPTHSDNDANSTTR